MSWPPCCNPANFPLPTPRTPTTTARRCGPCGDPRRPAPSRGRRACRVGRHGRATRSSTGPPSSTAPSRTRPTAASSPPPWPCATPSSGRSSSRRTRGVGPPRARRRCGWSGEGDSRRGCRRGGRAGVELLPAWRTADRGNSGAINARFVLYKLWPMFSSLIGTSHSYRRRSWNGHVFACFCLI